MDQAERYRAALDRFSRELWTILADVPPEISETPIVLPCQKLDPISGHVR